MDYPRRRVALINNKATVVFADNNEGETLGIFTYPVEAEGFANGWNRGRSRAISELIQWCDDNSCEVDSDRYGEGYIAIDSLKLNEKFAS